MAEATYTNSNGIVNGDRANMTTEVKANGHLPSEPTRLRSSSSLRRGCSSKGSPPMRVAMSVRAKTGSTSSDGSQLSERRPSHDREKIEGMVDSRVGSGGVREEEGTVKTAQRPQSREAQENENKGSSAQHSPSNSDSPPRRRSVGHARESSNSSSRSGVVSECGSSSLSSSSSLSHENAFLSRNDSFRLAVLEYIHSELSQQGNSPDPTVATTSSSSSSFQECLSDKELIKQLRTELQSLKEENSKLRNMRSDMDDELHQLTENLFEEAYKMVDEAKGGKMVAEKRLADAAGKIDAMETEVSALKNLLHCNAPSPDAKSRSLPHAYHHHKHKKSGIKKMIKKIKRKSTSSKHHTTTVGPVDLVKHKSEVVTGAALLEGEPIQEDYEEFEQWLDGLSADKTHPYLDKIVATDLKPCLLFRNTQLSEELLHAVEENNLLMESLTVGNDEMRECALSGGKEVMCTHRIKIGDSEQWHYISQQCRDRIAAACEFYMYIGHIQKGILKLDDPSKLYWQVARLRAMMTLARLTLSLPEDRPLQ